MNESKRVTPSLSDPHPHPHEIGWDADDAPELDDAWFATADRRIGDTMIPSGKGVGDTETFALPTELVERFRSKGPDWQRRIEAALKEWIREHPDQM